MITMIINKKTYFFVIIALAICLAIVGICGIVKQNEINNNATNSLEESVTETEIVCQTPEPSAQLTNNDLHLASRFRERCYEINITEENNVVSQETKENESMPKNVEEAPGEIQGKYLDVFELTAYCYGNITATGTTPTANRTIAVDPKVIPLGRKVYIEGYGTYIAEDTGGVVKGNIIDIYIPGYDNCINFGRRTAKVYLLD